MMAVYETIMSKVSSAVGRLEVRSALNPFLWLGGVIVVPCILLMIYAQALWQIVVLCIVIFTTLLVILFAGVYLLLKHPDKLQSEQYQLGKQYLEMIQNKGELPTLASELGAIVEPDSAALPSNIEDTVE